MIDREFVLLVLALLVMGLATMFASAHGYAGAASTGDAIITALCVALRNPQRPSNPQ
jgi:hypothetical protein